MILPSNHTEKRPIRAPLIVIGLCLCFFLGVFFLVPVIVDGLDTEAKMRQAQVAKLFNKP